uniref:Uncharacterized protein n=1 Tax=Rhizophora mucronata TaxID=61149 RepID=A0A2P2Q3M0_RHIMU
MQHRMQEEQKEVCSLNSTLDNCNPRNCGLFNVISI